MTHTNSELHRAAKRIVKATKSRPEDRPFICFDTETWLTAPGRVAPRLVCMSYDSPAMPEPKLLLRDDCYEVVKAWLEEPGLLLVNVRICYDLAVLAVAFPDLLPLIFQAFEDNRIADPCVWNMLYDIATGQMFSGRGYSMADLAKRRLDLDVDGKSGPDVWRFRYQELDGVPLSEWPQPAIDYPLADSVYSKLLWQDALREGIPEDFWRQMRSDWFLHLMGMWGIRTDQDAVAVLEQQLHLAVDDEIKFLLTTPLYKQAKQTRAERTEGTPGAISQNNKETALAVALAYTDVRGNNDSEVPLGHDAEGLLKHLPNRRDVLAHIRAWEKEGVIDKVPRAKKGGISRNVETLRGSGNTTLLRLAEISGDKKLLNTYVPLLQTGLINPRWNVLVNTGRTSCGNPNLQNQSKREGVRECFIPSKGKWFLFADYHVAEMCALAQVLLDRYGQSDLAELLRKGADPHIYIGAAIIGISYEEFEKRYKAGDPLCRLVRQLAKVPNFGLGGGMGIQRFYDKIRLDLSDNKCKTCYGTGKIAEKACGCIGMPELCFDYAKHLKEDVWLEAFPEMRWYFRDIGEMVNDAGGKALMQQHRSNRLHGGVGYCDGANGFFQGLSADGAKRAGWLITRECYNVPSSPLFGCRPVVFVHDEYGLEVEADYAIARPAAKRLSELMVQGMDEFIPDVPNRADSALMERWYKQAEPAYNEAGELVLWRPAA